MKRHVGKSELTKATAAHASEHEHVGQGGKTFREDQEVGEKSFNCEDPYSTSKIFY